MSEPDAEPGGSCDWGGCDDVAESWRWDDDCGWLPVCERHRAPVEVAPFLLPVLVSA